MSYSFAHRAWLVSLALTVPIVTSAQTHRAYGLGYAFELSHLPQGEFRARLEGLPEPARQRARQWLRGFVFTDFDLAALRSDADGGIFYADAFEATDALDSAEPAASGPVSDLTVEQVFNLNSKPDAANTVYLDFDGHVIPASSAWTSVDLYARPYDLDGDESGYNDSELANIAEIWRRIAEDYAPFDINVTTREPASFGPSVGRVLITRDTDAYGAAMPSQGSGGVAYVNVWGRSDYADRYSPALVYLNRLGNGRADYVSEAAAHELGHNLGLSHDSCDTCDGYYGGHGSGETSWGPIMGTGYNRNVSQWSNGDYAGATNTQDDLAVIDGHLTFRADDHGGALTSATRLAFDAQGLVASTTPQTDFHNAEPGNKGIIESRDDMDVFWFDAAGGEVDLTVAPAHQDRNTAGGNLDVHAALYDGFGALVTSADDVLTTGAHVFASVPAGRYYLAIQGTGSANYSDYGSAGQYFLSGAVPVAGNDLAAPTPDPMGWQQPPSAAGRDSIGMTATTAYDDSGYVEYQFVCVSGGAGCVASPWQTSPSWVASGLSPESMYAFQVSARDALGNQTAPSVTASATTPANQPPTALDDVATVAAGSSAAIGVLSNDSDPEGDTLAVVSVSNAVGGTVANEGGSVRFTPVGGSASGSFTYEVSDGLASAFAAVSVTVSSANQAPEAVADAATVASGGTVSIPVLANDHDPDGDGLVIVGVSGAGKGVVSWTTGQTSITYARNANRKGGDRFGYAISDGRGGVSSAVVYIGTSTSSGGGSTGGKGGKGKNR